MSGPLVIDLGGMTALVTGASSGLGAHFARVLARQGADLVLAARRRGRLEEEATALRALGRKVQVLEMDVTDKSSVAAAFAGLDGPLDILVNNSGLGRGGYLAEMEEEAWAAVVETNLTGVWRVAKAALPRLIAAKTGGVIINVASITAERVATGLGAYASSKAATAHLTRAMAVEFAREGIRVNALAPGYFETEMTRDFLASASGQRMATRVPMRRFGRLEELDLPLLMLAAPQAGYQTGSIVTVDGGHSIGPL